MSQCRHEKSIVVDSRECGHRYGNMRGYRYLKRRRRVCAECKERFTTYELKEDDLDDFAEKSSGRLGYLQVQLRKALEESCSL